MFWSIAREKQILKSWENFDFYGKLFKKSFFEHENGSKGPKSPIGTAQDHKNYFFELPEYENPIDGKRIFELFAIEKKLVGHIGRFLLHPFGLWNEVGCGT